MHCFACRNSLLGRSTRVAVVLIQRNTPLPPGMCYMASRACIKSLSPGVDGYKYLSVPVTCYI